MKRNTLSMMLKSFVVAAVILLTACQVDEGEISLMGSGEPIAFGASVSDVSEVRTRTLDSAFIASSPFGMDFYIQLCCDDIEKYGTYHVPSGYEGRLESKDKDKALNWQDLDSPHTFYAWNIPWNDDTSKTYQDNGRFNPDNPESISEGIKIKFYNSSEAEGYGIYTNNAIYENFIGAKSAEPYSYKGHGKYVDLTFHHLVSKIRIGSFVLIEASGAIQKHLQADVTFVGMPTEATFYPHPDDNGRPRVVKGEAPSDGTGVSFYIDQEATTEDIFYVCPEIDFSKVDFKVQLRDVAYESYNTYYGTFNNVEFIRHPGTDYDRVNGEDDHVLHAGEMMTINITLIPGVGPGLAVVIDKWSTEKFQESEYHANSGMYSDAEVQEFIDTFFNQKEYSEDAIKEFVDRLFEMYGDGKTENGQMIFRLFENVTYNSNILPIWKDCIIDGMGHTITMKTNANNTSYVTGPYFNVGPVRDVYLTDGTNTIYIDSDGFVWTYDNDKHEYVKTENQLLPLQGDEKSYDISCKDGKVHKSTYYNNSIVGG